MLKLGLPKGRMQAEVFTLLAEAGIKVSVSDRGYRPRVALDGVSAKILKPQNIVRMLAAGSRDLGFAGADWVEELEADVEALLDTALDPVRVVAAAPTALLDHGRLPERRLVVATEYERVTRAWIERTKIDATIVRSYGATEVFPPEDADFIVDNTATGSTLRANGLDIFDELMTSSTHLYAHRRSLEDPTKRPEIEHFVTLLRSVLEARQRAMIEVNVPADKLERMIDVLPAMRKPTVAELHAGAGYALKAAVQKSALPNLIRQLKEEGGTDIVVSRPSQIVP